jgi:hypothetical protein
MTAASTAFNLVANPPPAKVLTVRIIIVSLLELYRAFPLPFHLLTMNQISFIVGEMVWIARKNDKDAENRHSPG